MRPDYRLLIFSGLTIVLWGLWGFFGKLAVEKGMAPLTIFLAEILVSAACAAAVVILSPSRGAVSAPASWNAFGLISGVGLALGLMFYYFSLQRAQAAVVVPLTASYPLVSALLGHLVLQERLRPAQWGGVVLIVVGTVLLLWGPVDKAG